MIMYDIYFVLEKRFIIFLVEIKLLTNAIIKNKNLIYFLEFLLEYNSLTNSSNIPLTSFPL